MAEHRIGDGWQFGLVTGNGFIRKITGRHDQRVEMLQEQMVNRGVGKKRAKGR